MTSISSIIADAFREGNILPLGKAANANQLTEALRLLNGIFTAIYGDDAGEGLQDWPLGTYGRESTAPPISYSDSDLCRPLLNRRLIVTNTAAKTIYFPLEPQDGARMGIADPFGRLAAYPVTLNANGRTIENAATVVLNVNGTFAEWFYRADLGGWVRLTGKASNDEMPFPSDFDNFFVVSLAMRLNPRYGRSMDDQSAVIYKNERKKFVARYLQSMPLEIVDDISWPFLSRQSFNTGGSLSTRNFNRGSAY